MSEPDLLERSEQGLACPLGGFTVDPWAPVERAVITHAHADHACAGCGTYVCTPPTAAILRSRLAPDIRTEPLPYGETRRLGDVLVSLHAAGHVAGSAQVRVEPDGGGPIWVITGDYKRDHDATTENFELVPCDVLITESTFGLPIFAWPDAARIEREINAWRAANAAAGRTSVLLAYALGKAQRVMAALDPDAGPIGVHGATANICAVYDELGITLPPFVHANADTAASLRGTGTIVAPPSTAATPWLRRFAGRGGLATAMVSGWMTIRGRRRWRSVHTGFVLSDHADWTGLLRTIRETGARRIGVTHGYAAPLARYAHDVLGLESFVVPTRYGDEETGADGEPA